MLCPLSSKCNPKIKELATLKPPCEDTALKKQKFVIPDELERVKLNYCNKIKKTLTFLAYKLFVRVS